MYVIIKIAIFSLLFWVGQEDLWAQNKESKSSFALDSTEIVKIKEFFGGIDLDSIKILKIKQLIPDLDTVMMKKIRRIIPHIQYYNDQALERLKKELAPDYIPVYDMHARGWWYFGPKLDTVIVKGSEVPWRFRFNEKITYVELVGVGRAKRKDIQAGEWHIATKPQRTTTYCIKYAFLNNVKQETHVKVIVVESEAEAKKVRDEMGKKREADRKSLQQTIRYSPNLDDRR